MPVGLDGIEMQVPVPVNNRPNPPDTVSRDVAGAPAHFVNGGDLRSPSPLEETCVHDATIQSLISSSRNNSASDDGTGQVAPTTVVHRFSGKNLNCRDIFHNNIGVFNYRSSLFSAEKPHYASANLSNVSSK